MTRFTLRSGLLWLLCGLIAGWCVWSAVSGGVVATMFSRELGPAEKLARLKQFFAQFGAMAPLVYVVFVIIEVVVAPLPGAMLYAPGGIIFGGFWGGLLSLIGNVIGAGIACQLMRSVFGQWAAGFFEARALKSREQAIAKRGVLVVFFLRINPLTSSDIVSYAAGLTSIPAWKVMVGTALGMAPLCWAQAWLADELLTAFPQLLYPLLVACGIYAVVFGWILMRLIATASRAEDGR
jgi:uncharacterized membrane protein YdjX (TVP38/TMEM64 family)